MFGLVCAQGAQAAMSSGSYSISRGVISSGGGAMGGGGFSLNGTVGQAAVGGAAGGGFELAAGAWPDVAAPVTPPPSGGGTTSGGSSTSTGTTGSGTGTSSTGSTIDVPSGGTSAVDVDLPGTGKFSAIPSGDGGSLSVEEVTLPGAAAPVRTVTVKQGSVTLRATQAGQALAELDGMIVVSGAPDSEITVDARSATRSIKLGDKDTLVVPADRDISGTKVILPPPAAAGSSSSVALQVDGKTLRVQPRQANSSMTFRKVDVDGVLKPVLAVTGSARVEAGADNQPLVRVGNNVIRSGTASAGKRCTTTVEASSGAKSDTVQVVSCYAVLPSNAAPVASSGASAARKGIARNGFPVLKDNIVWAGETAEFDKNGDLADVVLGSAAGNTSAVGDNLLAGKDSLEVETEVPSLHGTTDRLDGASLDDRIFAVINQTGQSSIPTPKQSASGVMTFEAGGQTYSAIPIKRVVVDTSRSDGVATNGEGNVEITAGGYVTTFAPAIVDPRGFAAKVAAALPGATTALRANGSYRISVAGTTFSATRPAWMVKPAQAGAPTFDAVDQNTVSYSDGTFMQKLLPDFVDYTTLVSTFRKEFNDPALTVQSNTDGSITATVLGHPYVLMPAWSVTPSAGTQAGQPAWTSEGNVIYLRNGDGSMQGFTVK
ncbi:MAG: hypothetical protein KGZ83_01465 [Sulfuricella sp.]|nr:hypothetical protein [Sulfuricella sp.]